MTNWELRKKLAGRKVSDIADETGIHPNTIRRFINDAGAINKSTRKSLENYTNE